MNKRLLVIFAVRGTLLERLQEIKVPSTLTAAPHAKYGGGPQQYLIWRRPHSLEMLKRLSSTCDLGIWSSATPYNTQPVLDHAFPGIKFDIVLTRDNTKTDSLRRRHKGVEEDDQYATVKNLDLIWGREGAVRYLPERTVLVDDTASKGRKNADNLVWVKSYGVDPGCSMSDNDRTLLDLADYVEKVLVPARDVRDSLPKSI